MKNTKDRILYKSIIKLNKMLDNPLSDEDLITILNYNTNEKQNIFNGLRTLKKAKNIKG